MTTLISAAGKLVAELRQVDATVAAFKNALLLQRDAPHPLINRLWEHFQRLMRRTSDPEERLTIARRAEAVMDAFKTLPPHDLLSLTHWHCAFPFGGARVWGAISLTDPAEIIAAHPVLGPVHAEIVRMHEELQAAEQQRREEDGWNREPPHLLAMLRNAGVALALDEKGNIVATRAAQISEHARERIAARKPEIVALLKAEALRPEVIA